MVLTRLAALSLAAIASRALAIANPADQVVQFTGVINSIDVSRPHAVVHLTDPTTGRRYAMDSSTPNTFKRLGIDVADPQGLKVGIEAVVIDGGACKAECRVRMRSMTLPNGNKVFLGCPGNRAAS